MAANLTDAQIEHLIRIEKTIPNLKVKTAVKRGSHQVNYEAAGPSGEVFRIYARQNIRVPEGFSCGLLFEGVDGQPVTLLRYNGSDHVHHNPLDSGTPLPLGCHIHRATERYINAGRKAEHFAETTDRYTDLRGALEALAEDCNVSGLYLNGDLPQLPLL